MSPTAKRRREDAAAAKQKNRHSKGRAVIRRSRVATVRAAVPVSDEGADFVGKGVQDLVRLVRLAEESPVDQPRTFRARAGQHDDERELGLPSECAAAG